MNVKILVLLFSFLGLSSCQEDTKQRFIDQEKEAQKREVVFANINKGWSFNAQPANETSRALLTNWSEWRIFLRELSQKPKSSIGAFQQKAKTLSLKAADLNNHIPFAYDKPEVKSRIAALTTQVNALNLYIHLNNIPDKKVVQFIQDINIELVSVQRQLDEIDRKSKIKTEDGEANMIRMLDTTRAIPSENDPKLKPYK
jgi:hypothetical protein